MAPKAFAVLAYLVERAGRLVTQEELLDAVWPGSFVEPQAVKKHIAAVRSVLGDKPRSPNFIETVSKHGYRFIAPVREVTASRLSPRNVVRGGLVGRSQTLDLLHELWSEVIQGDIKIVLITGEPGIGKTALAREFSRQIAAEEAVVRIAQGQCVEGYGSKEPYGPILDALGRLCRGVQAETIVKILVDEAPTWLLQMPGVVKPDYWSTLQRDLWGATRERMLREIAEALESISAKAPLLLLLDDLQWADGATIDLISYIARRGRSAKLMIVATSRRLDGEASDHPTRSLLRDLLIHRLCVELSPSPLTEENIREFLTNQSPGLAVPDGLAEIMHRRSEGNPLFVVAALEQMKKADLLSLSSEGWQLHVPLEQLEHSVPDDLRHMIEAEFDRLAPEERAALELASVVGNTFSAGTLYPAIEIDRFTLENLFEKLAKKHFVIKWMGTQSMPDGSTAERYEFTHVLYRHVLYERIGRGRKATLHRSVGEGLCVIFQRKIEDIAPELAYHFEQAGDWSRAITYLKLASGIAGSRRAHAEAAEMITHALQKVSLLPVEDQSRIETDLLATLAAHRMAAFDPNAIHAYESLAQRAEQLGMIDVQAQALLDLAFYLALTSVERCLEIIDRAHALSEHQTLAMGEKTRAACAFRRLSVLGWQDVDLGELYAGRDVRNAKSQYAYSELVDFSMLQWLSGNYRDALNAALEVRTRMFEPGAIPDLADFEMASALAVANRLFLGECGDALEDLAEQMAAAKRNHNPHRTMWVHFTLSWVYLHIQDFDNAIMCCHDAAPLLGSEIYNISGSSSGIPALLHAGLICMGSAAVAKGDLVLAERCFSNASRDMDEQPVLTDWYWRILLEIGLTELALAKQDISNAATVSKRLLARALEAPDRTWQGLAWEAQVHVFLAERDFEQAKGAISQAITVIQDFDVPLAAWKVYGTAAEVFLSMGDTDTAHLYRDRSREVIMRLARSLNGNEDSKRVFLSSLRVSEILKR